MKVENLGLLTVKDEGQKTNRQRLMTKDKEQTIKEVKGHDSPYRKY
jgi:hypothetical protein